MGSAVPSVAGGPAAWRDFAGELFVASETGVAVEGTPVGCLERRRGDGYKYTHTHTCGLQAHFTHLVSAAPLAGPAAAPLAGPAAAPQVRWLAVAAVLAQAAGVAVVALVGTPVGVLVGLRLIGEPRGAGPGELVPPLLRGAHQRHFLEFPTTDKSLY